MILKILRLILFVLSMTGYVFFTERKTKIQVEFLPIIVVSMITTLMFFAGILNILPLATLGILTSGIILLIYEIMSAYNKNNLKALLTKYMTPGIILFGLASIYFLFLLKEQRLVAYDNFSHWAVIVKDMLMDDALPNFEDKMVAFNTYPPGSALFIYYFCRIVGVSEGLALFGQMIITLSSILSIFSFSSFIIVDRTLGKKQLIKNNVLTLISFLVALYLLNGPSSIHNLLVDSLLNVVGLSLFALVYYYLYQPDKIWKSVTVISILLTLIKNSGMFFAYFAIALYAYGLYRYFKDNEKRVNQQTIYLLTPFVAPISMFYLWSRHVKLAFGDSQFGKHTMSLDSYVTIFNQKSSLEIQTIINTFFKNLTNHHILEIGTVLFLIFLLILVAKMTESKFDKRLVAMLGTIFTIYCLYSFGVLAMYLVSMPIAEALSQAAFSRYMDTIMNFIVGMFVIGAIYYINRVNSRTFFIFSSSILLLFFWDLTLSPGNYQEITAFRRNTEEMHYETPIITDIEATLDHLSPNPLISKDEDNRYLFYYPTLDSYGYTYPTLDSYGYTKYFISYRLYSNNFDIVLDDLEVSTLWDYDYIAITSVNNEIKKVFEENSKTTPQVGIYSIDKENMLIMK